MKEMINYETRQHNDWIIYRLNNCVLSWCAIVWVVTMLTGCGIRKVDLWGAKLEFADGWDVHAGLNNIGEVDDHRGINSKSMRQ